MYVGFLIYQPNNFISVPKISELSDNIFTLLLILFLIANTWKQTRYLSADEWIQRMGKYKKEYCTAVAEGDSFMMT